MDRWEQQYYQDYSLIAGFDEVGRGCVAGPLVAAAVILPAGFECLIIKDSKKLSASQRQKAFEIITKNALDFSYVIKNHEFVEQYNPKQSSIIAMQEAFLKLKIIPEVCLIDAEKVKFKDFMGTCESIIKGDDKSINIAAASIIAKVIRDEIMIDYHSLYPEYDFINNKGYYTSTHKTALELKGITPIHRRTYRPVKDAMKLEQTVNK